MNRPNPLDFKVHGATKFFHPYLRRRLHHNFPNFPNIHNNPNFNNNTTGKVCGCVYI